MSAVCSETVPRRFHLCDCLDNAVYRSVIMNPSFAASAYTFDGLSDDLKRKGILQCEHSRIFDERADELLVEPPIHEVKDNSALPLIVPLPTIHRSRGRPRYVFSYAYPQQSRQTPLPLRHRCIIFNGPRGAIKCSLCGTHHRCRHIRSFTRERLAEEQAAQMLAAAEARRLTSSSSPADKHSNAFVEQLPIVAPETMRFGDMRPRIVRARACECPSASCQCPLRLLCDVCKTEARSITQVRIFFLFSRAMHVLTTFVLRFYYH